MKVIGITNQGLTVISLLVLLLWAVIFAEQTLVSQVERDYQDFRRSQPAASPVGERPMPARRMSPVADPIEDLAVT